MNDYSGRRTLTMTALICSSISLSGCATTPVVNDTRGNEPSECQSVAFDLVGWLAETDLVPARELITHDISNEKLMADAGVLSEMGEFKGLKVTNAIGGDSTPESTSWALTTTAAFGKGEKIIVFTVVRDDAGRYRVKNMTIMN
jgi:hypothetical protein